MEPDDATPPKREATTAERLTDDDGERGGIAHPGTRGEDDFSNTDVAHRDADADFSKLDDGFASAFVT
jgi:hypothetical protein